MFKRGILEAIRIPIASVLVLLFLIFARPTWVTIGIASALALLGLLIRAWSAGHIVKSTQVTVTGPYAYVRNPLYLGSFIMVLGLTVAANVWWLAVFLAVAFLGIYLPVMRIETAVLRRDFGEEYVAYEQNVPLFVPRLTPWKRQGGKFDFRLYLRHHEYRAALGVVGVLATLAGKIYFGF